MIATAIAAAIFLLYLGTYASIPTADGHWYLTNVERQDYRNILNTTSSLTQYLVFAIKALSTGVGLSVPTLRVIQTMNAVVAGIGAALVYETLRLLGAGAALALVAAALLGTSFGYWYFANGELQHVSLVLLLTIFYLVVRRRARNEACRWPFVMALGLINAVAVMFRQENFLFGFAAIALLSVGRPWRDLSRTALLYATGGAVGTAVLVLFMGHFVLGALSVADVLGWYVGLGQHATQRQDFQGFEAARTFDLPRLLKGQLTAFVVGTQTWADALLGRVPWSHRKVIALLALTGVGYVLMAWQAVNLWRRRRFVVDDRLAVAIACVVWLVTYKVVVHGWFWPTVTKYQVVTLPALIVLLVLAEIGRSRYRAVVALLLLIFAINAWGGILPWYRYGRMKDELAVRQARDFGSGDLFISCESGLDSIFQRGPNHLEVKNVFLRLPAKDAFGAIQKAIAQQVERNGRVYLYNFVPSAFTLIGINQSPSRGAERLEAADFERFFDGLQKVYALRPVFAYWEETKAPLYLFGERLEPFWELRARQ